MRTLLGTPGQTPVRIKSTQLEVENAGVYHYTRYGAAGRLLLGIKESGKFLALGLGLAVIPGEALLYGLFFLLFIPYEIYACVRLRTVAEAVAGACPACHGEIHIELQRDDRPTFWKYCLACGAALEIRHAD